MNIRQLKKMVESVVKDEQKRHSRTTRRRLEEKRISKIMRIFEGAEGEETTEAQGPDLNDNQQGNSAASAETGDQLTDALELMYESDPEITIQLLDQYEYLIDSVKLDKEYEKYINKNI